MFVTVLPTVLEEHLYGAILLLVKSPAACLVGSTACVPLSD